MQVYSVSSLDKADAVAKANKFLKTLKQGQFINMQMNPLQEFVVTERHAISDKSYTETVKNNFSFTILVMYEDKVDEPARPHYTSG